jgi:glutamate racemase
MAKIGVFDSGLGGLTVLKDLALAFPQEEFVYLGDTARLPYGTKSPGTIRNYSEQILNFLCAQSVDALVIACNTASSQVSEKKWKGIPVFNVIEPGARTALQTSQSQRIGVLGTRATIQSEAYLKEIQKQAPEAFVVSQSCPLFVPLAEEGWIDDPITNLIVYRYVQPLLQNQIDTLILGCTHYPLLRGAIQKACGLGVHLVHSGQAIAQEVAAAFECGELKPEPAGKPRSIRLLTTDFSNHLEAWARQILEPVAVDSIDVVHLYSGA